MSSRELMHAWTVEPMVAGVHWEATVRLSQLYVDHTTEVQASD